jgi:hypothetical protein
MSAPVAMRSAYGRAYYQRTTVTTDGAKSRQNIRSWFLTTKGFVRTAPPSHDDIPNLTCIWSDAYREMVSTITWMNDSRLLSHYESWTETNALENAMMENIQKYFGENTCLEVLFWLARHIGRPSLTYQESGPQSIRPECSGILLTG